MTNATIHLRFDSAEEANAAKAAIDPDNEGLIDTSVADVTLTITAESTSIMGLLRSLDDVLGCLRATGMD